MTNSGPAREGTALLQGIVLCGSCGRRLGARYKGTAASAQFIVAIGSNERE